MLEKKELTKCLYLKYINKFLENTNLHNEPINYFQISTNVVRRLKNNTQIFKKRQTWSEIFLRGNNFEEPGVDMRTTLSVHRRIFP